MATMAFTTTTFSRLQTTTIHHKPSVAAFIRNSPKFSKGNRRCGVMATYDKAAETAKKSVKEGIDAVEKSGEQIKKELSSAAENASKKIEDVTGEASETAQDIADKVKEAAEGAWEAAKDDTEKIKKTVEDRAKANTDFVKDTIKKGAAEVEKKVDS